MDFRRARRKARMQAFLARLRGKSIDLLSYDEVRSKLRGLETGRQELREIPLNSIVGSVGRYRDFTRDFLPRIDQDEDRWAKVKAITVHGGGTPPIEVYQLGDAYFVKDGNHRISVAKEQGASHIEAYVKNVQTKVPVSADLDAEKLILRAEYTAFLELTELTQTRPGADLSVTVPGRYSSIEKQIEGLKNSAEGGQMDYAQAAERWFDEVYQPFVQVIREQGLSRDFPGLTDTDLYLWISRYREDLERTLGWEVRTETAAADLAKRSSRQIAKVISRLRTGIADALTPDLFDSGPRPGAWRQDVFAGRKPDRFASEILVPLGGHEAGWDAWDQAQIVAAREGARVLALHVVGSEADKDTAHVLSLRDEFERRCEHAGRACSLAVEVGGVARKINERARWVDLVILRLEHPPGKKSLSRLSSGFRTTLQRCPRPLLAVPSAASPLEAPLLAYDGSPKSQEALFLSSYLAGRWKLPLVVVTVMEERKVTEDTLREGEFSLQQFGVQPTIVPKSGEAGQAILETAEEHGCDFIIMGGYGMGAVREVVLGSTVDQILRETQKPVLICR